MAPRRVLWTWTVPDGATRVELELDGASIATPRDQRLTPRLDTGEHVLRARACEDEACSDWSAHQTVVEAFGEALPRGLHDAGRAFARTTLGRAVSIGCDRCVSGGAAPLASGPASAALELALRRKSDVIQLPVASVGGELRITANDLAKGDGLLLLSDVLSRAGLVDGDALVLLDLVENEPRQLDALTPAELAGALHELLETVPSVARNGRPLLVRSSYGNRGYLAAVRDALADDAVLAPYVHYVLRDREGVTTDFYAADAKAPDVALVPSADFIDAVSISYTAPDLPKRITLSRRAGRAVIIDGLPATGAAHGHALISALRDQADLLLTGYPADRARELVVAGNRAMHFDANELEGSYTLPVWRDPLGGKGGPSQYVQDLRPKPGVAGDARALTSVDARTGLLPPAIQGTLAIDPGLLSGYVTSGYLSAAFGAFRFFSGSNGGVSLYFVAENTPAVSGWLECGEDCAGTPINVSPRGDACDRVLASMQSPTSSHWVLMYRDKDPTVVIDGVCVATQTGSDSAGTGSNAVRPNMHGDGLFTSATVQYLPLGYDKYGP